jgi:linalool 8-monooxygenase
MTHERLNSLVPNPSFRRSIGSESYSIDLKSPDFHARADQYDILKYLRDCHPIYWNPESGASGFWAVTRFEDIEIVARARDIFSSDYRRGGMRIFDAKDVTPTLRPDIFTIDPPDHTTFRKALQPLFSPEAVATFRDGVRSRARRLIANVAAKGRAEFVSEIANPVAVGLLTDLLELPESDGANLIKWSNAFVGDDDNDYCPSIDYRIQCARALDQYVAELLHERAGSERKDFLSILTRLSIKNKPLDFEALCENFATFIVATNETTRHTITRSMDALTQFPAERGKLHADLSLLPAATKEFMRWTTPLIHSRRTTTRDTILAGQEIKEGSKVVIWYKSANRDERRWPDAMQFRIDRYCSKDAPGHIAFGSGINHCLGWRFAEMQITILFEELLSALPDIRAVGAAKLLRSNFISGIKALDVEFSPVAYWA